MIIYDTVFLESVTTWQWVCRGKTNSSRVYRSCIAICTWRWSQNRFDILQSLATLTAGYIVLDTQLIVGGKHAKYRFCIDDYCMDRALGWVNPWWTCLHSRSFWRSTNWYSWHSVVICCDSFWWISVLDQTMAKRHCKIFQGCHYDLCGHC